MDKKEEYKNLRPINTNIIIEPLEEGGNSGMTYTDKNIPCIGLVRAISVECTKVKVGQKVQYKKWNTIDISNSKGKVIEEKDILFIYE